jgi:sulfur relay (sulfurtransferase) complex TusBCD TusD component (DsrE family)
MKYSIFINPHSEFTNFNGNALQFVRAILDKKHSITHIFFYGYAVKCAFEFNQAWSDIAKLGVTLIACSTIADTYLNQNHKPVPYFKIRGLGHWIDSVLSADKYIEFI